jgi:hypothetical protein
VTLEGEPTQHLAYFACDSFNQILEFDITDFDASGLPEINSLLASPSSSPTTTPASRPC